MRKFASFSWPTSHRRPGRERNRFSYAISGVEACIFLVNNKTFISHGHFFSDFRAFWPLLEMEGYPFLIAESRKVRLINLFFQGPAFFSSSPCDQETVHYRLRNWLNRARSFSGKKAFFSLRSLSLCMCVFLLLGRFSRSWHMKRWEGKRMISDFRWLQFN